MNILSAIALWTNEVNLAESSGADRQFITKVEERWCRRIPCNTSYVSLRVLAEDLVLGLDLMASISLVTFQILNVSECVNAPFHAVSMPPDCPVCNVDLTLPHLQAHPRLISFHPCRATSNLRLGRRHDCPDGLYQSSVCNGNTQEISKPNLLQVLRRIFLQFISNHHCRLSHSGYLVHQ